MSSMIRMNSAHEEKISFSPASGSGIMATQWVARRETGVIAHHHPLGQHRRTVALGKDFSTGNIGMG